MALLARPLTELQRPRAGERNIHVRGDDREPAACHVPRDRRDEELHRLRVERDRRLVEKPERAPHRDEAGERQPPLLAGGKIAGGDVGERRQPEAVERDRGSAAAVAEVGRPEREVLGDRQVRLDAVEVPDEMRKLARLALRRRVIEADDARRRRKKPRQRPQKCRLAGAVRAPAAAAPRPPRAAAKAHRRRFCRRGSRPDFQQRAAQPLIIRMSECCGEARVKSRKMVGETSLAPGPDGLYKRHASTDASANERHPLPCAPKG